RRMGGRMSVAFTLVAIGIGAVLIAIWFDVRFPNWAPTDLNRMVAFGAAAALIPHRAVHVAFQSAGDSTSQKFVALFAVAFPGLVFMFLVAFWMLKLVQRSFPGFR